MVTPSIAKKISSAARSSQPFICPVNSRLQTYWGYCRTLILTNRTHTHARTHRRTTYAPMWPRLIISNLFLFLLLSWPTQPVVSHDHRYVQRSFVCKWSSSGCVSMCYQNYVTQFVDEARKVIRAS